MSLDTPGQQQVGSGGALGDTFDPACQVVFDDEDEGYDAGVIADRVGERVPAAT
jgi:hypothetical protein